MVKQPLGRIARIDPREYWKSESSEFTPWLAQQENISLLAATLGLELEVDGTEKDVGPFRADILCRELGSDQHVLIENQLEATDHTHLGQLITYASGLDAVTIIWIAKEIREEHRAALDWLNRVTDDTINFFGIEVSLLKIGESAMAPEFVIVSKPNNWSREVRTKSRDVGELTETRKLQLEYWTAFREVVANHAFIRCQKPQPVYWSNHAIGKSWCHLVSIASAWDSEKNSYDGGENRVEFLVHGERSRLYFQKLESMKTEIENEIGESLTWHFPSEGAQFRAYVRRSVNIFDKKMWPEQHRWLLSKLERFYNAFGPRVRALTIEE